MKTKSKFETWERIFLAAMFCFAVSLFNRGGYIFAFCAVIFLFFNIKSIKISLTLLALVVYSVMYFAFYTHLHEFAIENVVIYMIGPWAAYLMAMLYVEKSKNKNAFIVILLVLSAGMLLHGLLNLVAYFRSDYYSLDHYGRISVDFWRGKVVSATGTGMFYTFASGISLGVLFSNFKTKYKLIAAAVLVVAVSASVFFANRTLIAIVAIIAIWKLLSIAFSNSFSNRRKIVLMILLVVAVAAVIVFFVFNLGGFADWFFSLKIVQRYDDPVGRLNAWTSLFTDGTWLKYPFGNANGTHRHNLWLDIYDEAGVFPFLIIVCLTIYFIKRVFVFRSLMTSKEDKSIFCIFQCLCFALILNCAVEPVIEANPYYFLISIMFIGAMQGQIKQKE